MATPFDASVGTSTANSYCTVDQANIFISEQRLYGTEWDACANKEAALMWATREIDRFKFIGQIADLEQALKWPRVNAYLPDGRLLASTTIPVQVQNATAEMALWLSLADRSVQPTGGEFQKVKVGPIEVEYRDVPGGTDPIVTMPDTIRGMLDELIVSTGGYSLLVHRV